MPQLRMFSTRVFTLSFCQLYQYKRFFFLLSSTKLLASDAAVAHVFDAGFHVVPLSRCFEGRRIVPALRAYGIRQHTSAYVSIRQHTSAGASKDDESYQL